MTRNEDPVRLATSGSPALRALLRSAADDEPSPAQLERLHERLTAALAAPAAPAATGLGSKAWIAIAFVSGAAIVAAIQWARSPESRGPGVETAPVQVEAPAPAPPPAPSIPPAPQYPTDRAPIPPAPTAFDPDRSSMRELPVAPITRRPARPAPAATAATGPADPSPLSAPPAAPPPAVEPRAADPPPPAPPREMELLGPAQDALRGGDPTRALALATQHADVHPTGLMTEEREAIAIEALARLDRLDHATTRLARFVTRYPQSGYRARLERLVTGAR